MIENNVFAQKKAALRKRDFLISIAIAA